jgi:EVE domain
MEVNPEPKAHQPSDIARTSPRIWIFQSNPEYYRIIEALQLLDKMTFLVSRYKDEVNVDDIVLVWVSGKHAGIYAQATVTEGVAMRISNGPDAEFWMDAEAAAEPRPRVVLSLNRKFLANPVPRSEVSGTHGLQNMMILRQPNGTNFAVSPSEWAVLKPLLPTKETIIPTDAVLEWATKRARGRKLYDQTCGQLLERYVREHFSPRGECPKARIMEWFTENYPLFKPITVQCHIEKYTTNFRSRVHYNASPEHDLLYRESGDWSRLRLYRPGIDSPPIYELDSVGGVPEVRRAKKAQVEILPLERHRRVLAHLVSFGELTGAEEEILGASASDMTSWLDALLVARPGAKVVSPLFLALCEGDVSAGAFSTKLAVRLMGDHFQKAVKAPLEQLEDYIWQHFGKWHLRQPNAGDERWHGYLASPAMEPADQRASERLDIFAQLPSSVIGDLVRDTSFLGEQQAWSAQAAGKMALGPLSRQLKTGIRRPLFLSQLLLPEIREGVLHLGELPESEVIARAYVAAGLPLCSPDEFSDALDLQLDTLSDRVLENPLYAVIVQIEVHRMMAGLSDHLAAGLRINAAGECNLDFPWGDSAPLWPACRKLLVDLGYWPVCSALNDSQWQLAVTVALQNLQTVGVLELVSDWLRITETFSSRIKAHPAHPQNRGEKDFRVRLLQFLESLQGDQR